MIRLLVLWCMFLPILNGATWYVSTTGTAGGNGSENDPWDLQTALSHPAEVSPGDTILVKDGTYNGCFDVNLFGTSGNDITVEPENKASAYYPVTIEGCTAETDFVVINFPDGQTGFVILQNFIIQGDPNLDRWSDQATSAPTDADKVAGIFVRGEQIKIRNNIIINNGGDGIGLWKNQPGGEAYGNVIMYNGWQAVNRPHGHGIYTQNEPTNPQKRIADNLIGVTFANGINSFSGSQNLDNYLVEDNIVWNAGGAVEDSCLTGRMQKDLLWQEGDEVFEDIRWEGNHFYNSDTAGGDNSCCQIRNGTCTNVDRVNNIGIADNDPVWDTTGCTLDEDTGNTIHSRDTSGDHSLNQSDVIVNEFEPSRCHVVIYNAAAATSVSVDLSSCLSTDDNYEIRDAENPLGAAIASGTYSGGSVSFDMTTTTIPTITGTGCDPDCSSGDPVDGEGTSCAQPTYPWIGHTTDEWGAFIVTTTTTGGDTTDPTPGNSGTITTANVDHNSFDVNWTKATDDTSAQANLDYLVCRSTADDISTVANCESKFVQNYTTDIATYASMGLSASTTYYHNVVVRDEAGNKALYTRVEETTSAAPPPPEDAIRFEGTIRLMNQIRIEP